MTVFVIVVQVVLTTGIGNVIANLVAITHADTVADIDITRIDLDVVVMVSATISATAAVAAMIAVIAAAPVYADLVEGPTPAHAIAPARPRVIAHMESPGGCAWVINSAYIRGVVPAGTVNRHAVIRVRTHVSGGVTHVDNLWRRIIHGDIGCVVNRRTGRNSCDFIAGYGVSYNP